MTAGTFLNEIFLTSGQGSRQTAREKWNLLWTWPWVGSRHRTSVFINKFSIYDNLWCMMLVSDPPATVEQPGVQVLVSHLQSYEWSDINKHFQTCKASRRHYQVGWGIKEKFPWYWTKNMFQDILRVILLLNYIFGNALLYNKNIFQYQLK